MQELLKPIENKSLKEIFVDRFEELILSGRLSIGQKLPSERELALQMSVSRPVVHEGLVELASRGLITMKPRLGAMVNDYRRFGSPEILNSLFNYQKGNLDPKILRGVLSMRLLIEVETGRLAARNRTDQQLDKFRELINREGKINPGDVNQLAEVDFEFHHLVTLATDNPIYPLLLNSMKSIYTNLTRQFFQDATVLPRVFAYHREFVDAITVKDEKMAVHVMQKLLNHGEERLNLIFNGTQQER